MPALIFKVPRHAVCNVILNLLSQVEPYQRDPPWPKPIASLIGHQAPFD
jgi:hypothetical protein